jgi:hypothetical protein
MATVYVGSARIDEHGNAHGGDVGDQTGREVCTQAWYKHTLGWNVIRIKDATARQKNAAAMKAACANNKIGYNQDRRDSLYNAAKPLGFDLSKAVGDTDCSALVRVCLAYAGIIIPASPRFSTYSMLNILKATGKFEILTDLKYTDHSDRLMVGDILVTKTTGHTVIVLNNGDLANGDSGGGGTPAIPVLKRDLYFNKKNMMHGEDVKIMQQKLISKGFSCGKTGADGWFGRDTNVAVLKFQKKNKLVIDGIYGIKTHTKLWS